jgi:hypothetical protein
MTFAERLGKLDFRWIWAIVMAIVWASVLAPISVPVPMGPETKQTLQWFDSLPKGSTIFLAPEYSSGSYPELDPQDRVVAILAFQHGLKIVIGASGFNQGPQLAEAQVESAAAFVSGKACTNPNSPQVACGDLKYGTNWVNIGYKQGSAITENALFHDFQQATQGVDFYGQPLANYPLTKDIKALNKQYFSAIWVEDTGTPGCPDWLANVGIPSGLPIGCGCIIMSGPNYYPYLTAGQFKALLIGARDAGEIEAQVHAPGLGLAGQETAMFAAVLIVIAVIAGNYVFYSTRRKAA